MRFYTQVSEEDQRAPSVIETLRGRSQRISGNLPLRKSFLSSGPDTVSGPADAEPLLLKESED